MPKVTILLVSVQNMRQFQRIGLWRNEGERFQAPAVGGDECFLQSVGVFGEIAQLAAHIPAANHHQPDADAAEYAVEIAAEIAVLEHEQKQQPGDQRSREHEHGLLVCAGSAGQQRRQVLPAGKCERYRIEHTYAERPEQPSA